MADEFDPAEFAASKPSAGGFDPAEFAASKPPQTAGEHLKAAGTDIWPEIKSAAQSAFSSINENLNPWSEGAQAKTQRMIDASRKGFLPGLAESVSQRPDFTGPLALAGSPITGAGRSVIGHALAAPGQISYEQAKEQADLAMMGLGARGTVPKAVPAPPVSGPFGVTLSEGQETGNLAAIQREQAALRNAKVPGHERAQEFATQQKQELTQAQENVARGLDPTGQMIFAENPQEAGQLVSQGIQSEAARAKKGVRQAYDTAKALPGEIHAGAFEGIGQKIKGDLTLGEEPVIIDDKTTPHANNMIRDIDDRISKLRIQNSADPFGQPNPERITGINLQGVDQMRKRLSSMRRDAYAGGNAADGRAAQAVIDAFDNHIDQAVNGGMFNGDPRAITAWNDARAAYADYRQTFTGQKNDPVGKVIDKITGRVNNTPEIPNAVADHLFGSMGTRATTLNVGVANRVKNILGEQSPEWIGVKQGLFSKIDESPQAVKNFDKLLNGTGKELSEAVYAPHELQMLREYADLKRKLQIPQMGANWSNTSTFQRVQKVGEWIGATIGHFVGSKMGLPPMVGELTGAALVHGAKQVGSAAQARRIANQMPLVAQRYQQWQRAVNRAQRANNPSAYAAVTVAANDLNRIVNRIHTLSRALLPAHAGEGEDKRPGEGNQQKNGGVVGVKPRFAHGGKVFRDGGNVKADGGDVGATPSQKVYDAFSAFHPADSGYADPIVSDSALMQMLTTKGMGRLVSPAMMRLAKPGYSESKDRGGFAKGGRVARKQRVAKVLERYGVSGS